jgi:hypothetical protein
MLRKFSVFVMALALVAFVGCAAHTHIIGDGAKGNENVSSKQWYAVWGLASLNKVDSKEMAGSATNYEIHTETSFVDAIISGILGGGLISCRTVTVKK